MSVTLTMTDESLEVRVADRGTGANRTGPPVPPNIDRKMQGEEPARGLGMFLIQSLVDEAEWGTGGPDGGSYVRLLIRLKKEM